MFRTDQEEKVLGILWNHATDKFHFKVQADLLKLVHDPLQLDKMTKRKVLSQVSRIYDPVGFAAPSHHKSENRNAAVMEPWSRLG